MFYFPFMTMLNPLSANPTKWPNKVKQFVGELPINCLSFWRFCKIGAETNDLYLDLWTLNNEQKKTTVCNKDDRSSDQNHMNVPRPQEKP